MSENHTIRIALADDHNLFRVSLARLLDETEGFAVVADAPDGVALMKEIARLDAPPDVVLLDVQMPNGGGFEALTSLKKSHPDTQCIILSMLDHDVILLKMFRAGAAGYLLKDQDPEVLIQAIRAVAGGSYFFKELGMRIMRGLQSDGTGKDMTLSARQETFLRLACTDMTYKAISLEMKVEESTVDGYREKLFSKFKVSSRVGLAMVAVQLGIV